MKKTSVYMYPAVFTYEEGQEIAVVFPDLNAATSGADDQDALLSARELLGCVLNGLEEDGEDIPVASKLEDIQFEDNERVVLVDVFMPAVRMANVNKAVSRTVTIPAWLNAAAMEKNVNFSQVLQKGLLDLIGSASKG